MDYNENELTRNVFIEKIPFYIRISIKEYFCGWWYGSDNGLVLQVRNGGKSDLKQRTFYNKHLTDYGFYVVVSGKRIGSFVSKRDAVKLSITNSRQSDE